jgi:hypothetical protein
MEGHPGLACGMDCEAQWIHGGPAKAYAFGTSGMRCARVKLIGSGNRESRFDLWPMAAMRRKMRTPEA